MVNGEEIARHPIGDVPVTGDEVVIEDEMGLGLGGAFTVERVRRVYGSSGAHTSTSRAIAGGVFDVVPRVAHIHLTRT
jgi:hypothetical protein